MTKRLIIDWKEYNLIVEKLAVKIHQSGFKPTMLIGIMRGGAPIIDVLSRIFKLKCAYLAVESYSGTGVEDQQGELVFSREMSSTVQNMGGRWRVPAELNDEEKKLLIESIAKFSSDKNNSKRHPFSP